MRDVKKIIEDFEIAIKTDAQLQETTEHFRRKYILTDSMIESIKYCKMEEVMDICIAIPSLKEKLVKQYEAQRADELRRANQPTGWENADMSNRSNW